MQYCQARSAPREAAEAQTGSCLGPKAFCRPPEMLPLPLQFIIAMVAFAIDERLARRIEYLLEEVRVLREVYTETTGRKHIPFTDEQRRRLAIKGKALTPEEREACCQIARPSTILTWFRQLAAQKYDSSTQRRKLGRPRKATEIRELVIRLASENIGWGYTKIRDALRGLKIEIGRTTVANILAEAGIEPAPERNRNRTLDRLTFTRPVPNLKETADARRVCFGRRD